jgi:hypothetical protein
MSKLKTARESVSDDCAVTWESLAEDLNLEIDPNVATSTGELLVEFGYGSRIKMGKKMKLADVREQPIKIKCSALTHSGSSDDLYLLLFINADVPSCEKPTQR